MPCIVLRTPTCIHSSTRRRSEDLRLTKAVAQTPAATRSVLGQCWIHTSITERISYCKVRVRCRSSSTRGSCIALHGRMHRARMRANHSCDSWHTWFISIAGGSPVAARRQQTSRDIDRVVKAETAGESVRIYHKPRPALV